MARCVVAALAVLGCAGSASASDDMVTDRPDFTESAVAVESGRLQIEAGAGYETTEDADGTTLGEILVRIGLARDFELRLELGSYAMLDHRREDVSGFEDSGLGFKKALLDGTGTGLLGTAEAALIVATSVPTGSSELRSSAWQPSAVLALGWQLDRGMSLGANVGVSRMADDGDRFSSAWASVALGVPWTDRSVFFLELYGHTRERPGGPTTAAIQTGMTYSLSRDLQLDARVARRVTSEGPDLLLGVGCAWRR